jgi:hypothetical protein
MNQNQLITPELRAEIKKTYDFCLAEGLPKAEAKRVTVDTHKVSDSAVYKYAIRPRSTKVAKGRTVPSNLQRALDSSSSSQTFHIHNPKTVVSITDDLKSDVYKSIVETRDGVKNCFDANTKITLEGGVEKSVFELALGDVLKSDSPAAAGGAPAVVSKYPFLDELKKPVVEKSNSKTFIITGWEIRNKISYEFVDCLRQMAKEYDARLMLAPCYLPDLMFLPNEIRSAFEILESDYYFNENLFFKFTETHALASSPLTGWKGFSECSAIIPGLIKELFTEASTRLCKQYMTTGSIGTFDELLEDYSHFAQSKDHLFKKQFDQRTRQTRSQKKPTALAREYVVPSAVIVEVLDDKTFLTRYVTMETTGIVFDLNRKFTSGKTKSETIRPRALNVGDTHAYFHDRDAVDATLEQIGMLKPQEVILNDFFDGVSANYHEKDRAQTFHQAPTIEDEVKSTKVLLNEFLYSCRQVNTQLKWLASNHCDFLIKYLDAGEKYWRLNYNYDTCVKLQHLRRETGRHPVDILFDFASMGIDYISDSINYKIGRVFVEHGHRTINGKRAGFKQQAQHYNRLSMNHTHSPAVYRNSVCGGVTAMLKMPYMSGISGILHANTIIHEDGSQQLLPIINGQWI